LRRLFFLLEAIGLCVCEGWFCGDWSAGVIQCE
jgi:hypothetical protein